MKNFFFLVITIVNHRNENCRVRSGFHKGKYYWHKSPERNMLIASDVCVFMYIFFCLMHKAIISIAIFLVSPSFLSFFTVASFNPHVVRHYGRTVRPPFIRLTFMRLLYGFLRLIIHLFPRDIAIVCSLYNSICVSFFLTLLLKYWKTAS